MAFDPPPTQARPGRAAGPRAPAPARGPRARSPTADRGRARVGVRAGGGADQVVGGLDVGDPVADAPRSSRPSASRAAESTGITSAPSMSHADDVELLAADVLLAHVDVALQAEPGAHRRRGDAVLAGAGLGDDPRLAHPQGEQDLADRVVDLVRARVVRGPRASGRCGRRRLVVDQPLGEVERRRPADVVASEPVELAPERRVGAGRVVTPRPARRARPSRVSGTNRPPNSPKRPRASGTSLGHAALLRGAMNRRSARGP